MEGVALARPLTARQVRAAVDLVFRGERRRGAAASVTFLSSQRMRALNRRTFGRDRATDVIAFGLRHGGRLVADIYVCPAVARREAAARGVAAAEELARVLVHGALHAAGWDHPGAGRERSAMWRRQERYLARVRSGR